MQPVFTRVLIDTQMHTHDIFTLCENTHMGSYYPQCLLEKFYIGLHSLERAFVQETCRYLCSQISTRKTRNVKHSGCLLKRRRRIAYLPPRRLGTELVDIQVTFVLVIWTHLTSSPNLYLESVYLTWSTIPLSLRSLWIASFTLSLLSQSMEPIIIEDGLVPYKSFDVVMPSALLNTGNIFITSKHIFPNCTVFK